MAVAEALRGLFGSDDDPEPDPTAPRLSKTTKFDILRSRRRQLLVEYLRDNGAVRLPNLSGAIAALENDVDPADLTQKQQKRVYVSLYQTHLPKLDELGVVDYDNEYGTVEPGAHLDEVAALLDFGSGGGA